MAHLIPMSPSEIPPQGYRLELPLPRRPEGFVSIAFLDERHRGLVPRKMPPSATPLAQLEWACSYMNNTIASYDLTLNRAKSHWILWHACLNDGDFPWHWDRSPLLLAERGDVTREEAGLFLFEDALVSLRDRADYDRFRWINDGGKIRVHRIEAIGDRVWKA